MKKMSAKIFCLQKKTVFLRCISFAGLFALLFYCCSFGCDAYEGNGGAVSAVATAPDVACRSAILIEESTGTVLFEKNADEALPPASVTKIMTLLLVMEAVEDGKMALSDKVRASAHACSMGGSQIFLKEGEEMTAEDMLKSVIIASANDAAVALAEHSYGSEEAFVARMNERSAELGMKNTAFENTNGLDDTTRSHLTSARDISIMSRELLKHTKILEYSSKWTDTVRNGAFGLTNTNKLVRFYKGATGLKTGSTDKAGFCVSATAKRDGLSLICVIMGAKTPTERNACASRLLDYGFSNYALYENGENTIEKIPVRYGVSPYVDGKTEKFGVVLPKESLSNVESKIILKGDTEAPIKQGDIMGSVVFSADGKEIGRSNIFSVSEVEKMNFWKMLGIFISNSARIM